MEAEPQLDFEGDLKAHFIHYLSQSGYAADQSESVMELGVRFFSVLSREISDTQRTVHEASDFSCPSEFQLGYDALKTKIECGENVNPNLSSRLIDANYQDMLLWDWGIHHFHLGQVQDSRGFVTRTGPLLYAHATDTNFYAIAVLGHGNFSNQTLIRIIHRDWPDLLATYKLQGVLGLSHSFNDQQVGQLRRAGVQAFVEVDGVVYAPMGGGYTTAGTSTRMRKKMNKLMRVVKKAESWIKDNADEVRQKLREKCLVVPAPLEFRLLVQENGLYAVETQSKVAFLIHSYDRNV